MMENVPWSYKSSLSDCWKLRRPWGKKRRDLGPFFALTAVAASPHGPVIKIWTLGERLVLMTVTGCRGHAIPPFVTVFTSKVSVTRLRTGSLKHWGKTRLNILSHLSTESFVVINQGLRDVSET